MLSRVKFLGPCLLLAWCGCATRSPPAVPPAVTLRSITLQQPQQFGVICAMTVKGGTLADLQLAMAAAQACITVEVEPLGFRLFDVPQAGLSYDAVRRELQVQLNGTVLARQHVKLTGAKARVAVCALDCFHFFDVDTATGVARQQERYEVDYVLTARLGLPYTAWRDVSVQVNGQPADWEDFIGAGLRFDWLPPEVTVTIEGTDAQGRRVKAVCSSRNETLRALRATRPTRYE